MSSLAVVVIQAWIAARGLTADNKKLAERAMIAE